jgi:membrane-associated protease RseP (regulator of RpoE activity)
VPHYFPTCGGVASSGTELTAVLANPAPVGASWRVLCSYRSGFEGGGVVVGRPAAVAGRFEGTVDGAPYVTQWRSWRRLVPAHYNSIGDVVTVPGVALQWQGWPHRVDSDEDDRSRRPDVTAWPCVITEKVFEGAAGPLRGLGALAVRG